MTSCPVSRPKGGDSSVAPENWKIAIPTSGPIIHGSGVRSQAHSAPLAAHTASAPAIAAILFLSMARILPFAANRRFRPVAD